MSLNQTRPFWAHTNYSLDVSTTTASVLVRNSTAEFIQLRIYNSSSVIVFITTGVAAVTSTTAQGYALPAGSVEVISVKPNADNSPIYLAGITASGSGTIYIARGEGV
jgi:hypothetical protein